MGAAEGSGGCASAGSQLCVTRRCAAVDAAAQMPTLVAVLFAFLGRYRPNPSEPHANLSARPFPNSPVRAALRRGAGRARRGLLGHGPRRAAAFRT